MRCMGEGFATGEYDAGTMADLDETQSAAELVARQLRRELLNGDLNPGDRLREGELSVRFQRGRYTIRAALKILIDARLLTHERNRGAVVPALTRDRIEEVFGYRSTLELGSLRLALLRHNDFTGVERAFDEMAALPADVEWRGLTEAHARIHGEIVRASQNSRLVSAYEACQDELRLLFVALRPNFSLERFVALHRVMLDGLHQGGDAAMEALRNDVEGDGYRAILEAMGSGADTQNSTWRGP